MNLPTLLTVLRLLAAPLLAVGFLVLPRLGADVLGFVLFVGASVTDWFDGYLARRWKQETRLGAMLDPIADKAMVAVALLTLAVFSPLGLALLMPGMIILFREVFVSGLREFLGQTAGTLKVTQLAKWKTTVQLVAIAVLFAQGIALFAGGAGGATPGGVVLDPGLTGQAAAVPFGAALLAWLGLGLLWLAAALTLISGVDYFRKALPHLREKS
ncbi:CDP-diacylglycerol--glycerol-3-phosphate 3-phosphatidyltransferase [Chachezhania sediminis]|uniref:CDP-diacylglycerol--glycerol-3-phosphate 3-phosphatidyltransferase n=1 Tax=Chachezhania sediminis TaxID=2599291 RepID=UPI00131E09B9|nr:CDP-diacylglycerol--glycerol-3-phosphate 3-phosphatidyltransferase [Chachezhania sediminis]